MALKLLRTVCADFGSGVFLKREDYYNTETKQEEQGPLENAFSCGAYERVLGEELDRYCGDTFSPGETGYPLYVVTYAGNGTIAVAETRSSIECPLNGSELSATLTLLPPDPDLGPDQLRTIRCHAVTTVPPLRFILPNPSRDYTSPDFAADYDVQVGPGRYRMLVEDGSQAQVTTNEIVIGSRDGDDNGDNGGDDEDPLARDLKWYYEPVYGPDDPEGNEPPVDYLENGTGWRRVGVDLMTKEVYSFRRPVETPPQDPLFIYSRSTREVIDSYYLLDGKTFRQVRHDGKGGVIFDDTVPEDDTLKGDLRVLNIIKNDIDTQGTATGSVWIEVETPSLPVKFDLSGGGANWDQNTTGQFSSMPPGNYNFLATDAAGRQLYDSFTIEDRYRLRWLMDIDDYEAVPLRVEILERDYEGASGPVCGGETPIVRGWDGGGTDPLGALPEVLGMRVQLQLVATELRQFEILSTRDDKMHRVDIYQGDEEDEVLVFRGYIAPETYREVLLEGPQYINVIASDGLGALGDTLFLNHVAKPMLGRRPLLSTILHCLSRTDTNLPVHIGGSLREELMTLDGEPLLEAWARRTAYGDKATCREVLKKILRSFFLHLFQRNGAWWIESYTEVDAFPVHRSFSMEGLPLPAAAVPGAWHIVAPGEEETEQDLNWLNDNQTLEVVPAAAVVESMVKLQLEKNLLQNGDFLQWTADNTRPLYWSILAGLPVIKADGEKVKQYALELRTRGTGLAASGLLSSAVQVFSGQDESPLRLSITARVPGVAPTVAVPKPEPRIVRLSVVVLVNGEPLPEYINFEFTSADKKDTQEVFLPVGLNAGSARVKLLPVELVAGPANTTTDPVRLLIDSVVLDIVPSLRDWPDEDNFFALNTERGYVQLPTVELTHADMPRLALANGLPSLASAMDVLAWRHALSRADNRPTERWARPGSTEFMPLLETAAKERLELRTVPGESLVGVVDGEKAWQLGVGSMLDAVNEADGKFLVIACQHTSRSRQAQLTVRKLRAGSYTVTPELTGRIRWTEFGPRVTSQGGYRTTGE
jgi:hypothetical protein